MILGSVRDVITTSPNVGDSVLQVTDYYPFGMEIPVSGTSDNQYKYNGKELQDEAKLNWYDYGARFYDPVLGRWHSVDKLAEHPNQISYSPYQYGWNNPVNLNDPDGNCPWCIIGAVIGAAFDYGSQVAVNYATGNANPWTDVNVASIVASTLAGAATGGLASVARTGAITTSRAIVGSMTINAAESITNQAVTDGIVNPTQVAIDVAAGQFADGIPTKNIVPTKQLESQLNRIVRVAGDNPRASRAEAVVLAQGKLNAANNINQTGSAAKAEVVENTIGATGAAVVNNNSSSGSISTQFSTTPVVEPADNTRVVMPLPILK